MKIPNGWLTLHPLGELISGTQFVAFKVPLSDKLCSHLPPEERFTPSVLKKMLPNLGLIIDLTNTNRYYDKREFSECGIKYSKIFIPGKVIPSSSYVNQFIQIVDSYSQISPEKYIGVHCTHGINRTGYLICMYMISRLCMDPHEAVDAFQTGRGCKIYRLNYKADLLKRKPNRTSISVHKMGPSVATDTSCVQPPPLKNPSSTFSPDEPNYSQRKPYNMPSSSKRFPKNRRHNEFQNDYENNWHNKSYKDSINNNSHKERGNNWRNNSHNESGNNWRNNSHKDSGNNWRNNSQQFHQYNPLYNEEYNSQCRPRYNGRQKMQLVMRPDRQGGFIRNPRYSYVKPNDGI